MREEKGQAEDSAAWELDWNFAQDGKGCSAHHKPTGLSFSLEHNDNGGWTAKSLNATPWVFADFQKRCIQLSILREQAVQVFSLSARKPVAAEA